VTSRKDETERFDSVIIAAHSDQALRMLRDPTPAEREVFGSIRYEENQVVLHTDSSLLPRRRLARASWNAHIPRRNPDTACVTYYLNSLQGIESEFDFCVTLNRSESIAPSKILRRLVYSHPVYDKEALAAQSRWQEISGINRTSYCGAYWGFGFHEDGVASGLRVCEQFGKEL
jgi:predicted NAD/FAD-binding protein